MGLFDEVKDFGKQYATGFGVIDAYTGKAQRDAIRESNRIQAESAAQNVAAQREFAQHGVRWKVADAKAAGIHPLVALGAPTASFNPVSVGHTPDTAVADAMVRNGQDIARAVSSTSTQQERDMATLQIQSAKLDVEGKALDNQIRAQRLRELQSGPPMPSSSSSSFIPGQGDSGSGIIDKPLERTRTLKNAPHSEPGAVPDVGWVATPGGGLVAVPSKDAKERMEDNMFHETTHFLRNNVAPIWGGGPKPPKSALPKGKDEWRFNGFEWRPHKRSDEKWNSTHDPMYRRYKGYAK